MADLGLLSVSKQPVRPFVLTVSRQISRRALATPYKHKSYSRAIFYRKPAT